MTLKEQWLEWLKTVPEMPLKLTIGIDKLISANEGGDIVNRIMYVTVALKRNGAAENAAKIVELLEQGYNLLSAVGDGEGVHYILIKEGLVNDRPKAAN